jgi:hypothetical protein
MIKMRHRQRALSELAAIPVDFGGAPIFGGWYYEVKGGSDGQYGKAAWIASRNEY